VSVSYGQNRPSDTKPGMDCPEKRNACGQFIVAKDVTMKTLTSHIRKIMVELHCAYTFTENEHTVY